MRDGAIAALGPAPWASSMRAGRGRAAAWSGLQGPDSASESRRSTPARTTPCARVRRRGLGSRRSESVLLPGDAGIALRVRVMVPEWPSEREHQIQPGAPFFARPQLHTDVRLGVTKPADRTPFASPPLMRVQRVAEPPSARRRQPGRASPGCCAGASCCTRSASPRSAPAPRSGCRTARRPGTRRAAGR